MSTLLRAIRCRMPWLEPWYDWSRVNTWRLNQVEHDFSDEAEGEVWLIELQWFGLHFAIQLGRQPRKVSAAQVLANKARNAAHEADRLAEAHGTASARSSLSTICTGGISDPALS